MRLAVVVGVPDNEYGEVPIAFVEALGDVSPDALVKYCRESVAGFKVPRPVHFIQEWPMSATKIQVETLRQQAIQLRSAR